MHHRKDANHTMIVDYLQAAGAVCLDMTGDPEIGFDVLVAIHGNLFACEIKDGSKMPSAQRLTEGEQKRMSQLAQVGAVVWILRSLTDCDELLEWARND